MRDGGIRMYGAPWCGDCKRAKQLVSAAGEGATAALMIRHYLQSIGAQK